MFTLSGILRVLTRVLLVLLATLAVEASRGGRPAHASASHARAAGGDDDGSRAPIGVADPDPDADFDGLDDTSAPAPPAAVRARAAIADTPAYGAPATGLRAQRGHIQRLDPPPRG